MVKANAANFAVITLMAVLGILLLKSLAGIFKLGGLSELIFAV